MQRKEPSNNQGNNKHLVVKKKNFFFLQNSLTINKHNSRVRFHVVNMKWEIAFFFRMNTNNMLEKFHIRIKHYCVLSEQQSSGM